MTQLHTPAGGDRSDLRIGQRVQAVCDSLVSAQSVYVLVVLLTDFTEAWDSVDMRVDYVPLAMLLLAKVLSTDATAEWMVAEGILQTIIVNHFA